MTHRPVGPQKQDVSGNFLYGRSVKILNFTILKKEISMKGIDVGLGKMKPSSLCIIGGGGGGDKIDHRY
jgi:hypothetical protein